MTDGGGLGDFDDMLALTVRSLDSPFVGYHDVNSRLARRIRRDGRLRPRRGRLVRDRESVATIPTPPTSTNR